VQSAIRRKAKCDDVFVLVLGDAKELREALKKVKGFRISSRPYDEAPGALMES
jgi:hypothetical protein